MTGGERIAIACRAKTRMRGLLGTCEHEGLMMLAPCCDVHTFGMRNAIDIAFLRADGVVVASYRDVGAGRRIRHRAADVVIERFSQPSENWPRVGDVFVGGFMADEIAGEKG